MNVAVLLRQNSGWVFENPCKATASVVSCRARGGVGTGSLPGPSPVGSAAGSLGGHALPSDQCRGKGSGPVRPQDFRQEVKGLILSEV